MPEIRTTLRQILVALGELLIEVHPADAAGDVPIRNVAILDPDDELGSYPQSLVLVIGARGREAIRFVRAAARRHAVAAAVKLDAADDPDELRAVAADANVALLVVAAEVRWEQLASLAREVLDSTAATVSGAEVSDLFSLAQTIATLAGGPVSIEDPDSRVLAYSRSDDEVDELRRLSILGWEGPQPYLATLREWGVFDRLRAGEDVVHIDEHPDLGIRRRLAVGIRAGSHNLGTIWVQQGSRPFAERAETALVGAARVAATYLLRRRVEAAPGGASRQELLGSLLDGGAAADRAAGRLGLDPAVSAVVLCFAAPAEQDPAAGEWHRAETLSVVSVHVTSYRRGALVTALGSRVYAVLPDVPSGQPEQVLTALAADIVAVLRTRTGLPVRAAAGSPAGTLADVARSRGEADRVLDAMARGRAGAAVGTMEDLRAEVLLGETLALLEANPDLRDRGVEALVAHDERHGTELVRSLLAYLDALGDVRAAAEGLHVHPNTLRYRIRRASTISGIDLADPQHRLVCHLHLLLATR